ncbi:hypothetical protein [Deinococcus sp. UYEF24]
MALTLNGVPSPQSLANHIVGILKDRKRKSFKAWQVNTEVIEGVSQPVIFHAGDRQWAGTGSFKFSMHPDKKQLVFIMHEFDVATYPYLHGRLLEQLIAHCQAYFTTAVFEDTRPKVK